jgi:hypothetical protein
MYSISIFEEHKLFGNTIRSLLTGQTGIKVEISISFRQGMYG